jgi:GxxExxY protein
MEEYRDTDDLTALTEMVIACGFSVSNTLGCGSLEKVYENALAHELRKAGMGVRQQYPIRVTYDGLIVGDYAADLLVQDRVLIELKAVRALDNIHFAQCLNYLKATGLCICLLMDFGRPRLEVRRIRNDWERLEPQMNTDKHR